MTDETAYNQLALEFSLRTNRSVFLTGKAGTGKTTFLRRLRDTTEKQIAVVAPTGVAAINAGGTTIHSFFQLPFTPFFPTPEGRRDLIAKMKMQGNRRRVLQELELLVIDEISMVRADLLDAVDCVLRHYRYRNNEPFGGVQLIFIGDMFQLSPVANEEEWRILSGYYQSPYFFHSQVVLQQAPVYIEFEKIYRQTNEQFIRILNEIRNNCLSPESHALLAQRYNPLFVPPSDDSYITLTTHNYKADCINAEELAKLTTETYFFDAVIQGDYSEKAYPAEKTLALKVGAKVMFLKNDTENPRRFYNGKIGRIEAFEEDTIIIKSDEDDELIELARTSWENIRYSVHPDTKQIEEKQLGSFIQFPLRLAWAITIHKSQGLTFDKAVIDAGEAFAPGQVYVALSRCRSLEGLVLLSKINPQSIQNSRQIIDYEQQKRSLSVLEDELSQAKREQQKQLLSSIFDFKAVYAQVQRLFSEISTQKDSFNEETLPFLQQIVQQLQSLEEVGTKFQHLLQSIFNAAEVDENHLYERLNAAKVFFEGKLNVLSETLRQSPAATDSRSYAINFNERLEELFSDLALKQYLLANQNATWDTDNYFSIKNKFVVPAFSVNAYAKTNSAKVKLTYPDLYFQLVNERNNLCEPQDLPIYIVAGSKTLFEMSEYLPRNEKELLKITGFGPAKVTKYGQHFLTIINTYCEKHRLQSRMDLKDDKKRERKGKKEKEPKEKEVKIPSSSISLELFNSGKSIGEIAQERNLAISTIGTHLAKYVELGELDIEIFLSKEQCRQAEQMLENSEATGSVYQVLKEAFNNVEIMMLLAWIRGKKK